MHAKIKDQASGEKDQVEIDLACLQFINAKLKPFSQKELATALEHKGFEDFSISNKLEVFRRLGIVEPLDFNDKSEDRWFLRRETGSDLARSYIQNNVNLNANLDLKRQWIFSTEANRRELFGSYNKAQKEFVEKFTRKLAYGSGMTAVCGYLVLAAGFHEKFSHWR